MKKDYGIRVGETIQASENVLYLDVMYKGKIVGMKVLTDKDLDRLGIVEVDEDEHI